ncbi:MAG TPA: tRNA (adenosine(37)-N6)-threonylcarbamoyltransferase complex transferase subunit TsaD [Saprospiraceae bacterium]|nr:tRNA (adenosine(37)-N6)-threonylcarbamoyltransferase complex transferase subunit TsaD [Saprospiraceae bacterium]MCB9328377.1 tRNA (adenosine(37)-N6)-threonylcarbamoyltransferase complex transferase subunit TsaD [Lewinellaceae bacterium]HPK10552.1 tRNA (adenosine(37)-N6)-threonylcarbamoyltransferase complex transferase subunit TsaD [Saprospiraceae bacterium]HRX28394.1 tRNA (adenosine(37)-N6)-threonylcarbamoyltransferase complex transferase subunit TsaD [Saprospiraceae bacterium]
MSVILAIESSCDDTSVAVIRRSEVLSNYTAGQAVHAQYGGVVPELASRKHLKNIVTALDVALSQAGVKLPEIDAIALTRGPGLLGSLIVGVSFAKGLALSLDIPLIEVHHMHAHILAHFAERPYPTFPFLCLTVSGGHTQIVLVKAYDDMEQLGTTIDDAAGEAFDKCGKMLGLQYPAGPEIDKLAKLGNAIFEFPTPQVEGYNFSFSGLKTSFLYFLKKEIKLNPHFIEENLHDLCASIQSKIVEILLKKLEKAAVDYNITQVAIAGGVSANSELRNKFLQQVFANNWTAHIPKFEYCTDNAAMIGIAGSFKYEDGKFADQSLAPSPRLDF